MATNKNPNFGDLSNEIRNFTKALRTDRESMRQALTANSNAINNLSNSFSKLNSLNFGQLLANFDRFARALIISQVRTTRAVRTNTGGNQNSLTGAPFPAAPIPVFVTNFPPGFGTNSESPSGVPTPEDNSLGKVSSFLVSKLSSVATNFNNKIIATFKNIDEIQARALGSNTMLQEMSLPFLGISMDKLATEVLDLREQGFKNVNNSTLGLISTMKLTNQNTASLGRFLVDTSLKLSLNNNEAQNLSQNLSELSVQYGVTQEKLIDSINQLSDTFKTANLFGRGAETAKGAAEVIGQLGARVTGSVQEMIGYLTESGRESAGILAQNFSIQNQFLQANSSTQADLIKQAATNIVNSFKSMAGGTPDAVGKIQADAVAQQLGGRRTVDAAFAMVAAMQDAVTATDKNVQNTTTFKSAQEVYNDSIAKSATALERIANKISPETAGTLGKAAAVGSALTNTVLVGALGRAAGIALGGAAGGPIGLGIGALVGLTVAGVEIWSMMSDQQKENNKQQQQVADNTRVVAEDIKRKELSQIEKPRTSLLDILTNQVAMLGPQKNNVDQAKITYLQEQSNYLSEINNKLQVMMNTNIPITRQTR